MGPLGRALHMSTYDPKRTLAYTPDPFLTTVQVGTMTFLTGGNGNETARFHKTSGWFRGLMAPYVGWPNRL